MGALHTLLRSPLRILLAIGIDMTSAALALLIAGFLRLGSVTPILEDYRGLLWAALLIVPVSFWVVGLYSLMLRRSGIEIWWRSLAGSALATMAAAAWITFDRGAVDGGVSRMAIVGFGINLSMAAASTRFAARAIIRRCMAPHRERTLIYGAGVAGEMLAADPRFSVVAFIDDDSSKWGRRIDGASVHPPHELPDLVRRLQVATVLIALPSANITQRRTVLRRLGHLSVRVLTVPMLDEIQSSQTGLYAIRPVGIGELLGRPPVQPDRELLERAIAGKNVLVTGAGGSIGSELCRQILRWNPHRLIVLEQSEFNLYQVTQELEQLRARKTATGGVGFEIVSSLGSVLDGVKVRQLMEANNVSTVFHAAAYKHVPIVEDNECEGAATNVLGTMRVAEAAQATGVERFIFVSTDKAVRPTSIMGATKRMAELVLQAMQASAGAADDAPGNDRGTRFVMVRFGNVLGSSGSVIPLFEKQIASGGPVTVTHADMTRYFMTIPEAAELVMQAGALGQGGEVYVLDMGDPVKIVDLARRMIELSGRAVRSEDRPDGDIEIQFTGLRPGEKLFEEIAIGHDVVRTTHEGIFRVQEASLSWSALRRQVERLEAAVERQDRLEVRRAIRETVAEYRRPTMGPVGSVPATSELAGPTG